MNTKLLLAALSQDLYRIAIGIHNNSNTMTEKFTAVALQTANEINRDDVKPHIKKVLKDLPRILAEPDDKLRSEDALTYSIIIQNSALSRI